MNYFFFIFRKKLSIIFFIELIPAKMPEVKIDFLKCSLNNLRLFGNFPDKKSCYDFKISKINFPDCCCFLLTWLSNLKWSSVFFYLDENILIRTGFLVHFLFFFTFPKNSQNQFLSLFWLRKFRIFYFLLTKFVDIEIFC